jgi:hypothetical protein
MKKYRNYTSGIGSIFSILFSFFMVIALLAAMIDEVKSNEYKFIKYYLITIIPIIFLLISFLNKYYGKIILDKNKLYINRIFYKQSIPFYNIVEIEEPYIMTIDKIIFLFPEYKEFWIELKILYFEYCKINESYFYKTDDMYEKLFAIMLELNEEELEGNEEHIIRRLPIYIVYFILLKKLINFSNEHSLYYDYYKYRSEIKKCIKEYKNKPNFA